MKKYLSLIMLSILLMSTMTFLGNVLPVRANPTTYYVSNSGDDSNDGTSPGTAWAHIQYAVNHVAYGDTIMVAAGTYDEQVVISQALTIEGAGDATIIRPGTSTLSQVYTVDGGTWDGWNLAGIIIVESVASGMVTVRDLQVDGINVNVPAGYSNCYPVGITYGESSGTVENVRVVNMNTTTYVDRSYGIWLNAFGTAVSDTVEGCTVLGYYRNGIMTTGNDLTFDIDGNTVTGPGLLGPVQLSNGICIADGSGGNVTGNTVTDNHYNYIDPSVNPYLSIGIIGWNEAEGTTISGNIVHDNDEGIAPTSGDLIYSNQIYDNAWFGVELEAGAADNNIQFNNITDNGYGIHLLGPGSEWYTGPGDEPGTGNTASFNNIIGNTVGVQNWDTTQTFYAEYNWWGDASGPGPVGPGTGDDVSSYVDYTPWLAKLYTTTETYADYKAAIVKAADRLVALQSSTDDGWDWVVTGLTSHSGNPSATNIYGVTALGLINAYMKTDDPTYLTAASNTAGFIKYGDPSAGDFWNGIPPDYIYYWGYSFDYKFLMEFAAEWGDPTYANYAQAAWAWQTSAASESSIPDLRYMDGNQSYLYNYFVSGPGWGGAWQASDYGLAAWEMGDTTWAEHMASVISSNLATITSVPLGGASKDMGMGWALKLLVTVDPTRATYGSDITTLINDLKSDQSVDGSWNDEPDTTAYVVMGLWAAGEYTTAQRGADWLVAAQMSNGGWSASPTEYSEVDSEAMQAIATAIPAYVYTISDYENAIASSADRLVALQSPADFGWDWYVTGLTSHSASPSATNLYGVTALGLIEAYLKTGNPTYLTAAENTADFMMYGNASNGDFYNGHDMYDWGRSSDYAFLMELSAVTDNTTYSDYALDAWAWQKANANDTRLGGSGQLAYADGNQSILYYDYTNYWIGTGCYGIASWEASDWGLAALAMGDTSWARDMADVINANVANIALPYTPPYIATNYTYDYVNMGIAWALMLLVTVDPVAYASSITILENQLLGNQLSDGSWSNWFLNTPPGESQTTAYAVMALNAAHEYAAARKGANWLVAIQFSDGGWSSSPSEYSEPDSEDMQALASTIPQLTVASAYDSPTPSGTTTYFAGTSITANVTSPVSGPSGTQYMCTGWTGTGDVAASGSGTTMIFTISQDSSITWNWKTQYYLTVVSPYNTAGGTGWYDSGATAYATLILGTVPIVPGWEQAVFTGWSDDASGTGLTSNAITMNGPKTAVAGWKIQFFLEVVTNPSNITTIPGEGWYDNWTYVNLTAPQYVPNATGVSGVRYNFTYWDVDGVSQGVGNNPISVHMNTNHTATAYFTLQYLIAFNQTGVGSDFTGTVVKVDDVPYDRNGASFWWDDGSGHTFAFLSPLPVGSGAKLYYWTSTTGLSELQSGSITASAPGSVIGNYVTKVHDVAVTSVVANRTWVYQGWPVGINVTIDNNGDFNETVDVTVYYNITSGGIAVTQNVIMLVGQSKMIAFTWDTAGVQPHWYYNYTLTAVASIPADFTPADNTLADGNVTVRMMFDVNGDGKIDGRDITMAAKAFGSYGPSFLYPGSPPSPKWNPNVDFNRDNKVDGRDLTMIARHFGQSYPP